MRRRPSLMLRARKVNGASCDDGTTRTTPIHLRVDSGGSPSKFQDHSPLSWQRTTRAVSLIVLIVLCSLFLHLFRVPPESALTDGLPSHVLLDRNTKRPEGGTQSIPFVAPLQKYSESPTIIFRRRSDSPRIAAPNVIHFAAIDLEGDWGDLIFDTVSPKVFRRRVNGNDAYVYEGERQLSFDEMDEYYVSSTYSPDDELQYPLQCERIAWKSAIFPVCNTIHEVSRIEEEDKYLG